MAFVDTPLTEVRLIRSVTKLHKIDNSLTDTEGLTFKFLMLNLFYFSVMWSANKLKHFLLRQQPYTSVLCYFEGQKN